MTCNHTWHLYEGITNRFEYCTQCDVKKDEFIKQYCRVHNDYNWGMMPAQQISVEQAKEMYGQGGDNGYGSAGEWGSFRPGRYLDQVHTDDLTPLGILERVLKECNTLVLNTWEYPTHVFISFARFKELKREINNTTLGMWFEEIGTAYGFVKVCYSCGVGEDQILVSVVKE